MRIVAYALASFALFWAVNLAAHHLHIPRVELVALWPASLIMMLAGAFAGWAEEMDKKHAERRRESSTNGNIRKRNYRQDGEQQSNSVRAQQVLLPVNPSQSNAEQSHEAVLRSSTQERGQGGDGASD